MATQPEFSRIIGRLRLRHLALLDQLRIDPNLMRAAQRLHMAQPTASKMLKEIEDVLETTLFERNRRGLRPTASGQALTRRAGIFMAEMRAAQSELEATRGGASVLLRIGVFPVAVAGLLPPMYRALQKQWPGLTLTVEEAIEGSLLTRLSDGEIDCVLGRIVLERLTPDLRHQTLYPEPTVVVCGTRHPLLKAKTPARAALLQQSRWMLPATSGALHHMVTSWLARRGASPPKVELVTASVFVTIELLNGSALLSILPQSAARAYARLGRVALVPGGILESEYSVGVVYRAEALDDPLIDSVVQTARECARNLGLREGT